MTVSTPISIKLVYSTLVALAVYFLYWFVKDSYDELFINPVHFFEDAYMFIRYAKIWHLGYGEAWNIDEGPVYGNTSQLHFLWVLVLTAYGNLSDDSIIKISSYIPALLFIAWLPWFCVRHSTLFVGRAPYQQYVLWLGIVGPLVYWHTPFAYHSLTGMDTSLSILMNLWLIDAILSYEKLSYEKSSCERSKSAYLLAAIVVSYLAYSTRPENILAVSLFSVLYFFFIMKDIPAVKKYIAGLALLLLADTLFKYFYFGDFLPLAFYSKKSGFIQGNAGAGFSHPAFYFFYFLSTILPYVILQFFSLRNDNYFKQLVIIVPAILTMAYFFTMMTVMNMNGRYFYPFTPYFITAAVVTFNSNSINSKQYVKNTVLAVVALLLWWLLQVSQHRNGDIVNYLLGDLHLCDDSLKIPADNFAGVGYHVDREGFVHVVNVLKDTPAGVRVAMSEHGFIGAKIPNTHIIDMTGLHDPYVAKHGFSASWLFEEKPDMIWLPHWHNTCMIRDILTYETFRQHYVFYPGLFTWGVALRKDSRYYTLLGDRVEEQVESMYPGYHLQDFEKQWP